MKHIAVPNKPGASNGTSAVGGGAGADEGRPCADARAEIKQSSSAGQELGKPSRLKLCTNEAVSGTHAVLRNVDSTGSTNLMV